MVRLAQLGLAITSWAVVVAAAVVAAAVVVAVVREDVAGSRRFF